MFAYINAALQVQGQMVAIVITATIQAGKVDELLILWRTSLTPARHALLVGVSHVSLLTDRENQALRLIALYPTRHAADCAWASSHWQTRLAALTELLQTNSLSCAFYTVVNVMQRVEDSFSG